MIAVTPSILTCLGRFRSGFSRIMKIFSELTRNFVILKVSLLCWASIVCGCMSNEDLEEVGASVYPPAALPEVEEVSPAKPAPAQRSWGSSSAIRPGDSLELFVKEDNSFDGKYTVRERGDIIIPSLGRIPVSGMSVVDAGSRIRSELEATHLKKATVIIDRVGRAPKPNVPAGGQTAGVAKKTPLMKIYMTGKVTRPGQHRIPIPQSGELGVYEAILIAGGLSQFADPRKVHLLRNEATGKKRKIPVNIRSIEEGMTSDPAIGDGDIVVVPEKVFGF